MENRFYYAARPILNNANDRTQIKDKTMASKINEDYREELL